MLADGMGALYPTCDAYCAAQTHDTWLGLVTLRCVGAWEEVADDCAIAYEIECGTVVDFSSDALCECADFTNAIPEEEWGETAESEEAMESAA